MDEKKQIPWWRPSLMFFADLNGWIIGPVLVAVIFGKWLDGIFGTEPKLLISGIIVAFSVSTLKIVLMARKYVKKEEGDKKLCQK